MCFAIPTYSRFAAKILENQDSMQQVTLSQNAMAGRPSGDTQNRKGKAKIYQVRQVLAAIDKLKDESS